MVWRKHSVCDVTSVFLLISFRVSRVSDPSFLYSGGTYPFPVTSSTSRRLVSSSPARDVPLFPEGLHLSGGASECPTQA